MNSSCDVFLYGTDNYFIEFQPIPAGGFQMRGKCHCGSHCGMTLAHCVDACLLLGFHDKFVARSKKLFSIIVDSLSKVVFDLCVQLGVKSLWPESDYTRLRSMDTTRV